MPTEIWDAVVQRSNGHEDPETSALVNEANRFFDSKKEDFQASLRRHIASTRVGWSIAAHHQTPSFFTKFTGNRQATIGVRMMLNNQLQGSIDVAYHPHTDSYALSVRTNATQLERTHDSTSWSQVVDIARNHLNSIIVGAQPDTESLDDLNDSIADIQKHLQEQHELLMNANDAIPRADWRTAQRSILTFLENETALTQLYHETQKIITELDSTAGLPHKVLVSIKQTKTTLQTSIQTTAQHIALLKDQIRFTNRERAVEVLQEVRHQFQFRKDALNELERTITEYTAQRNSKE